MCKVPHWDKLWRYKERWYRHLVFSDEIICTHIHVHTYTQRGRHKENKTEKDRDRERPREKHRDKDRQSDRENKLALQNMVITACFGGP